VTTIKSGTRLENGLLVMGGMVGEAKRMILANPSVVVPLRQRRSRVASPSGALAPKGAMNRIPTSAEGKGRGRILELSGALTGALLRLYGLCN
jgi:hypothetical protein